MKPIIFARISSMNYYKGITDSDHPVSGASYVKETGYANECHNFDAVTFLDSDKQYCLGFVMLSGGNGIATPQLHIENIVGCEGMKNENEVSGVTVVWCAKAENSKNIRVVGFYKNATVIRHFNSISIAGEDDMEYNFYAAKEDCVLLPNTERRKSSNEWFVPTSGRNDREFGMGRNSIWFAGSGNASEEETEYVEQMLQNIYSYNGENWIDEGYCNG